MVRTQIQLTEKQTEALKNAAAQRGVSMAELIRQSVDRLLEGVADLSPVELRTRAASVSGRFRSGRKDVSTRHDQYLSDAVKNADVR